MAEEQEKQKSQEELHAEAKAMAESHAKEWEDFINGLKAKSDTPLTCGEFVKALEFIEQDMAGLSQLTGINAQNNQALNHNFQMLVQAIQGGGQSPVGRKTQSGLILP